MMVMTLSIWWHVLILLIQRYILDAGCVASDFWILNQFIYDDSCRRMYIVWRRDGIRCDGQHVHVAVDTAALSCNRWQEAKPEPHPYTCNTTKYNGVLDCNADARVNYGLLLLTHIVMTFNKATQ